MKIIHAVAPSIGVDVVCCGSGVWSVVPHDGHMSFLYIANFVVCTWHYHARVYITMVLVLAPIAMTGTAIGARYVLDITEPRSFYVDNGR